MEEKLNEIIEKAEKQVEVFNDERIATNFKIGFMTNHGFTKEAEYLQQRKSSMIEVFESYQETVRELRYLLNAWES